MDMACQGITAAKAMIASETSVWLLIFVDRHNMSF
jgi:hypothetical protein